VAQKKGHCTAIFSADEEEETRLSVLFTLLKRWFLSTISCGVVRCGGHNMLSMIFTALQSLARTRSEMMRPYADIMVFMVSELKQSHTVLQSLVRKRGKR
jgi:hypothetical protein